MRENRLFDRLQNGDVLLGINNTYPSAGLIEGMARGWDFLWIDGQHGQMGYEAIHQAVRASDCVDIDALVRVPGHDAGMLGQVADLDPAAVMVPMINTADEARSAINALKFPPLGQRSYGGRRVIDKHGREYYRKPLTVVLQIETPEAVENIDAIANTEGCDVLFFGGDDMKLRLGLPINASPDEEPVLLEAIQRTAEAARAAGKACALVAPGREFAIQAISLGYQMIVGASDIGLLRKSSESQLQILRDTISGTQQQEVLESDLSSAYS